MSQLPSTSTTRSVAMVTLVRPVSQVFSVVAGSLPSATSCACTSAGRGRDERRLRRGFASSLLSPLSSLSASSFFDLLERRVRFGFSSEAAALSFSASSFFDLLERRVRFGFSSEASAVSFSASSFFDLLERRVRFGFSSEASAFSPSSDRKSTRLNSSHVKNSYYVLWLKKK